jgi:hypothetical protein
MEIAYLLIGKLSRRNFPPPEGTEIMPPGCVGGHHYFLPSSSRINSGTLEKIKLNFPAGIGKMKSTFLP